MLIVEVSINHDTIAEIGAANTGVKTETGTKYHLYNINTSEKIGEVTHFRADGAATLVGIIMDEVGEL